MGFLVPVSTIDFMRVRRAGRGRDGGLGAVGALLEFCPWTSSHWLPSSPTQDGVVNEMKRRSVSDGCLPHPTKIFRSLVRPVHSKTQN